MQCNLKIPFHLERFWNNLFIFVKQLLCDVIYYNGMHKKVIEINLYLIININDVDVMKKKVGVTVITTFIIQFSR